MEVDLKAQINVALKFQQAGQFSEAEKLYAEILEKEPNNASVLNLLGLLKYQEKKHDEAIELIQKAIQVIPCAYFYGNLGKVYFDKDEIDAAIECYSKALEFEPENFDALFDLAMALKNKNQFDEAIAIYKKTLSINPNSHQAYFNLGNLYYDGKNDPVTAMNYYKKVLEYLPNDNYVKYCLAQACIKAKNYKEGFEYFEARPSKEMAILSRQLVMKEALTSKPLWQGEPIKDKTLYAYYEAAYGDTIMYARYLPLLKDKCAKVLFKPQIGHIQLLKDADYGIEILDQKVFEPELEFDVHIPLMSIPHALGLYEEKDIPFKDKYLKSDPKKVQFYKENYFNNDKFKIGIKWQGNTNYDIKRKITLKSFLKLFDLPNTKFYSVQKGGGIEELEDAFDYDLVDLSETFNDFSDTAAAIENFDLVICNDTSVGHLTCALGKPCWMLLPYMQDWRWTVDISYSPWYNNIRLFKQNEPGNWKEVFDLVYEELKKVVNY